MGKKLAILAAVVAVLAGLYFLASNFVQKLEPSTNDQGDELDSLGYLSSAADMDPREGTILMDEERAQPGLTIVTSLSRGETYLVDLDGSVVHTWDVGEGSAHLDSSGTLYVLSDSVRKLSWNSKELMNLKDVPGHHDIWIGEDELIVLDRYPIMMDSEEGPVPIMGDGIAFLNGRGVEQKRIPVLAFARDLIPDARIESIRRYVKRRQEEEPGIAPLDTVGPNTPPDVFHINSVMKIERQVEGVAQPGDLLISIRELDLVAIIRPEPLPENSRDGEVGAKIVWRYSSDEILRQHHATLLPNDHILFYDNGEDRGYTRIVEVDPRTDQVVWQYSGNPPQSLYSRRRGSAQRLPNGNTLIGDADGGRVVEVTAEGEAVWEYLMHKQDITNREPLYRADKITGPLAEKLRERASSDQAE